MKVIGLMSGTSGDGIDAALCEIQGAPPKLELNILRASTTPYDPSTRKRILNACQQQTSHVDEICRLNVELAEQFSKIILELIGAYQLNTEDIDLIGSHGQSIWHDVADDGTVTATLQITEASVIAERTGITTLANFRTRDVAAGGQGAPLASYLDWLLLRHPTNWRAIQNIGGIGNVTFLPPLADTESSMIAFDTGPGNVLMDSAVYILTDGAQSYDADGALAAKGNVDTGWLGSLLEHPYYNRQPPKTTGRELYTAEMVAALVQEGQARNLTTNDIVATLTALTAHSISDAYQRFAPNPIKVVYLAGGGRQNPTLVRMLQENLSAEVSGHEALGIHPDHKEAALFALLAYETWHHRPGSLPEQTGARHPVVLGQITPGKNYDSLIQQTWGSSGQ